tara:strand:- start:80 stop:508 length:429 start_codon:yes stop_codon:yes gene_type:complete
VDGCIEKHKNYTEYFVVENIKVTKAKLKKVAEYIISKHRLNSRVLFVKTNNKADYDWKADIIHMDPSPSSLLDFVESVLHEIDHAKMRKKLGAKKYEKEYQLAGDMAVHNGKDFYWDNPFEKQARKYEKTAKKWMKKISHFA